MSHHHHGKHHADEGKPAQPAGEQPAGADLQPVEEAPTTAGTPVDPCKVLQAERDDLLARLQRLGADYQNYQKRVQRDIQQAREFANEDLLKSLLPVLDDIERALDHARDNRPAEDPLLVGTELVQKKALETLGKHGVTKIEAAGRPFDPEKHQALMEQPSADVPPRTVLQVLQSGYQLKGRTLRPASVIVSKEPPAA